MSARELWFVEGLTEGEWIALQRLLRVAVENPESVGAHGRQTAPLKTLQEKAKMAVRRDAKGNPVVKRGASARVNPVRS
jgi:hypothetical protein